MCDANHDNISRHKRLRCFHRTSIGCSWCQWSRHAHPAMHRSCGKQRRATIMSIFAVLGGSRQRRSPAHAEHYLWGARRATIHLRSRPRHNHATCRDYSHPCGHCHITSETRASRCQYFKRPPVKSPMTIGIDCHTLRGHPGDEPTNNSC